MPEAVAQKLSKAHVEGVGEPMTACFLSRADIDPKDWYNYLLVICYLLDTCNKTLSLSLSLTHKKKVGIREV